MKKCTQGILICLILAVCQSMMVFGAEPTVLTVEEAVTKAIAHSSELKKSKEDQFTNEENAQDLKDKVWDATSEAEFINIAVQMMQSDVKSAAYSKNEETKKDLIRNSITQFFSNVIAAEEDLAMYDQSIAINKKEYEIAKTKFNLGVISQADRNAAKNTYDKMLANRQVKEIAIANAYTALNEIMGVKLDTRYDVTLSYEYTPLGEVYLNGVIANAIDQSTEIKSLISAVDVAKYQLSAYSSENNSSSKEVVEISVTQAYRNLADKKAEIESKVISAYHAIVDLETEYEASLLELANMKKQLPIKETQLTLGKTTQLEVDKYKLQIAQQEEAVRKQVFNHEIKAALFKTPWLL